jgi:glucose/arabinose dehydrogenase
VQLPGGPINHHWTKNLIASADGRTLWVTVGSNSNVGERGMPAEAQRAAIWQVDARSGAHRVFASGLRNPVGLAWVPRPALEGAGRADQRNSTAAAPTASALAHTLWTVVNERDELGNDLVPDYLTSVKDGAFYGWPYSYFGANVDARVQPQQPALVARAVVPDYALGAHTASLGLAWSAGTSLPAQFAHGMFIGQHGSWNRTPHSGYKVVFVPFNDAQPSGALPVDVLTGFLSADGKAYGRPVGVALDATGALLVADDVGNAIWRMEAAR